jgi:hypothetical protein
VDARTFQRLFEERIQRCHAKLGEKSAEYADEDVLRNFKQAGHLERRTPRQALVGMMTKHVVSVYDLQHREHVSEDMWDEKLTDTINYLLLLEACLAEEEMERLSRMDAPAPAVAASPYMQNEL